MDDNVNSGLVAIEELLPPHTTEYRSGSVLALGFAQAEPVTEPIRLPRATPVPETA